MGGFFQNIWDSIFNPNKKAIENSKNQQIAASNAALSASASAQDKALAAQLKMFQKQLEEARTGNRQSLAAVLSGSQNQYDLLRQQGQQQLSWSLPRQMAGVSALQALPYLQSALGVPAYQIPTSVDTTALPPRDLLAEYQKALQQLDNGPYQELPRGNIRRPPGDSGTNAPAYHPTQFIQDVQSVIEAPPSSSSLSPSNVNFQVEASPLYKWQLQQAGEAMNRRLAAKGLAGSSYGNREFSRVEQQLGAEERQRQIHDLQNLVQLGLGIRPNPPQAASNAAQIVGNAGHDLGGLYQQAAQNRAGIYQNMGSAQANAALGAGQAQAQHQQNLAGIYGAYGNALAQQPSPFSQILNTGLTLYSLGAFGGGGGGFGYFGAPNTWHNPTSVRL